MSISSTEPVLSSSLPHALEAFDGLIDDLGSASPAVFLDYDGTLTEIAEHPDLAVLSENVRESLRRLASVALTGIISGRDLDNIRSLVQVEGLLYAGSHGFDLYIPGRGRLQPHPKPLALDQAEADLRLRLQGIDGIVLERKQFSLAVHYRQVRKTDVEAVHQNVDRVLQRYPDLRWFEGKSVIEVQPNISWDKGRALLHIIQLVLANEKEYIPLYIGDDTTDETAFAALPPQGIGICVSDGDRWTRAAYRLHNPTEVHMFLRQLQKRLETG